jgi:hypothetical protein
LTGGDGGITHPEFLVGTARENQLAVVFVHIYRIFAKDVIDGPFVTIDRSNLDPT